MGTDDQKKRWREEAEQLKKDLANRPKEVKTRQVPIKLGGKDKPNTASKPTPNHPSPEAAPKTNAYWRKLLGID